MLTLTNSQSWLCVHFRKYIKFLLTIKNDGCKIINVGCLILRVPYTLGLMIWRIEERNIMEFSKYELRIIKHSLKNQMLEINKDLTKRLKTFDYDEIDMDISVLDDYRVLLKKVARAISNE